MKNLKNKKKASLITIILLTVLISFFKISNPQRNYISYDNFGYYMYLPAMFIYNDIQIKDFSWVEEVNKKYNSTSTYYQFDAGNDNNKVIRFFIGMSILYAPGFAAGHIIALITDYPADGFSEPYQWGLIIWGLIFSIVGLIFLRKVLLAIFSDTVTSLTLIFLILGTNLYFFIIYGNDAPHVYLFSVYAMVLWFVIKWHKTKKIKDAIGLGLTTGLLIISRPSEITIIFLLLLWNVSSINTFKEKMQMLIKYRKQLLIFLLSGLVFAFLQMGYWKVATGNFIFFSYTDPSSGFDFLKPNIYLALFSFRKGWFLYSPLMLCAVWGFYYLYKKNKDIFLPVFIVFVLNIYFIASFSSMINYGYRAFIQSYSLMAIPLGFFIQHILSRKLHIKIIALVIFIAFMLLNIFQAWQIQQGIISGSRMTPAYYFATFLKTNATDEDRKLLLINRSETSIDIFDDEDDYHKRQLGFIGYETPEKGKEKYYDTTVVYEGNYSLKLDSAYVYPSGFSEQFKNITDDYYAWIRASVMFYPTSEIAENELFLVITFNYKGKAHKWRNMSTGRMNEPIKLNAWNTMTFDYLTPEIRSKNEILQVYVWNPRNAKVYIDNLNVEVFEKKK